MFDFGEGRYVRRRPGSICAGLQRFSISVPNMFVDMRLINPLSVSISRPSMHAVCKRAALPLKWLAKAHKPRVQCCLE